MPEQVGVISHGKGRLLLNIALLIYIGSLAYSVTGPELVTLDGHSVKKALIRQTLLVLGFVFHTAALTTSAYYRKVVWVMIPLVGGMIFLLVGDWLRLPV